MRIDDVVVGESYAAKYSARRHEAIAIEKVDEPVLYGSTWRSGTRQRRQVLVDVHYPERDGGVVQRQHVKASELTRPWADQIAEVERRKAEEADVEDAIDKLNDVGIGARSPRAGLISIRLTPDQARALAARLDEQDYTDHEETQS